MNSEEIFKFFAFYLDALPDGKGGDYSRQLWSEQRGEERRQYLSKIFSALVTDFEVPIVAAGKKPKKVDFKNFNRSELVRKTLGKLTPDSLQKPVKINFFKEYASLSELNRKIEEVFGSFSHTSDSEWTFTFKNSDGEKTDKTRNKNPIDGFYSGWFLDHRKEGEANEYYLFKFPFKIQEGRITFQSKTYCYEGLCEKDHTGLNFRATLSQSLIHKTGLESKHHYGDPTRIATIFFRQRKENLDTLEPMDQTGFEGILSGWASVSKHNKPVGGRILLRKEPAWGSPEVYLLNNRQKPTEISWELWQKLHLFFLGFEDNMLQSVAQFHRIGLLPISNILSKKDGPTISWAGLYKGYYLSPDDSSLVIEQNIHILPNGTLIKRHRNNRIQTGTIQYFDRRVLVLQIDTTYDENIIAEVGNYYSQATFIVGALKTLREEKIIWGLKVVQTNIGGVSKVGAFRYALKWVNEFPDPLEKYENPQAARHIDKNDREASDIYDRLTTNISILLEGYKSPPEQMPDFNTEGRQPA